MDEAEKLATQLQGRYGNLGVSIDRMTGSISMATDAQERFNEAMKLQAIHQIEAEIEEYRKNIRELREENDSLCGVWVNTWNTITFRGDKASKEIEANGDKISDYLRQMGEAQKRLDAIRGGDKDALTGGKDERQQLEEKISAGKTEKFSTESEALDAAKKVAEIEKKLTREQQTELQNEIDDIRDLRDEYKKLLETMLSFEKSKKQKDLEKIADLEGRLAEADAVAEKRIAAANERAKKKFDKEIDELAESFNDSVGDINRRRDEAATDREIDAKLKDDAKVGMGFLVKLISDAKDSAQMARDEFARLMTEAASDGDVTDEEKKRIQKAEEAYNLAEGLVDKYAAKLRQAQEATQKKATSAKPQGAFYSRAAQALRGNQMEQRMFQTTQEIEKHTKKAAELLKDLGGVGGKITFS